MTPPTLYFLRSSEQRIVTNLLKVAARLEEDGLTLDDVPHLRKYDEHYGRNEHDIGLYAMVETEVAGGAWVRLFRENDRGYGYVNANTPELVLGVKEAYRNQGIATQLLEQLFQEVARVFPQMSLCVRTTNPAITLYERLGFKKVPNSEHYNEKNNTTVITMLKVFEPLADTYDEKKDPASMALDKSTRGYYDL